MRKNYKTSTKNLVIKKTTTCIFKLKRSITTKHKPFLLKKKNTKQTIKPWSFQCHGCLFCSFFPAKVLHFLSALSSHGLPGICSYSYPPLLPLQVPLCEYITSVFAYHSYYSKTNNSLSLQEPTNYWWNNLLEQILLFCIFTFYLNSLNSLLFKYFIL